MIEPLDEPLDTTSPGFSRVPPPEELPGWDPSDSPLAPGGRQGGPAPIPADSSLRGLTGSPQEAQRVRVLFRVRREGWVARRRAARDRFRQFERQGGGASSAPRVLAKLTERRGILDRSRGAAVRPRFNLRGGKL